MFTFKENDDYNDDYNSSFRNCLFNKHGSRVYVYHFVPVRPVF